ncbi:MAG: AmmeMemoRadiSam system protein B [Elusimicrobiota bacterium]
MFFILSYASRKKLCLTLLLKNCKILAMKFFSLLFLFLLVFPINSCNGKEDKMSSEEKSLPYGQQAGTEGKMRVPAVAGQFYPADKNELSKMIDGFLSNTKKLTQSVIPSDMRELINGKIIGIISPHAGYIFSGQTSAWSYKQIEMEGFDTVILIGPSHKYPVKDAALWTGGNFSTPLGEVTIDEEITKELLLKGSKIITANNDVHIPEHSLEVQIPFLQKVLKNFKIVAVLINDENSYKQVAEIIATVIKNSKKSVLLVASTDMTHYPTKKDAEMVDKNIFDTIVKFNCEELVKADKQWMSKGIEELHCTLCGLASVLTVLEASKILGADKPVILNYSNSAASPYGDANKVVGYGAVAFVKTVESVKCKVKSEKEFLLTKESQKELLKIARSSIDGYLTTRKIPKFATANPELLNNGAVFVTLEKNHNLRGCIGTTEARMPIYEAVTQLAIAAAVEDYRFSPATKNELNDIKIEISVLSPLKKISSATEIIEGKHGVVVRKGARSGLFLPQVWEHPELAKKEAFLSELCMQKAGLEPDAWKKGDVDLYTFTVFAFKE